MSGAAAPPPALPDDGLPMPRRLWAILTVALAIVMAVLDTAIANVALPTIAADLHAAPADSIWVVNAYQLAVTISLLPLASLGDIYGYRRVFQVGLTVFTAASLLCSVSDSLLTLALARVVQGFGAAGIMSVNGALVRFIYPRRMLGQGIGVNALVVAVSSAVGPTVAAGILSVGPWPWLFAVNVPIGLLTFAIAARALPHTPRSPHRFDGRSAALNALFFGLLVVGLDGFGHGEARGAVAAELVAAAVAAVLLVRRQLAQPSPLLPVDLLRIPVFGLSVATSVCSFAAQALALVSLPFFFQDVLGRGQVATGLLLTPWPLAVAVMAPISGRLADRFPAGLLGGIGLFVLAAGLALTATLPVAPTAAEIGWRMALCGLGFGLFQSPNNRTMLTSAPKHRSGGAGGMLSTARLVGQTVGATMVATVFGLAHAPRQATTLAVLVGAGFAAAAAGVSLLRLSQPQPARAAE